MYKGRAASKAMALTRLQLVRTRWRMLEMPTGIAKMTRMKIMATKNLMVMYRSRRRNRNAGIT